MTRSTLWFLILLLSLAVGPAAGFNGQQVTSGPLTLTIDALPTVTEYETPQTVHVSVANEDSQPLNVTLEMRDLVDEWRAVGRTEQRVTVPAKGKATTTFQITAGRECHSALYPVHVYARFHDDGQDAVAHAVLVFETKFPVDKSGGSADAFSPVHIPTRGTLPLTSVKTYRVTWCYYDGAEHHLPVGWKGSEETSRANFGVSPVSRGETKQSLQMHPPYMPGGGSIFAEYKLQLPKTTPLRLVFFNAIRDHHPPEPPSDGVTFRVWVNEKKQFDRHTDSKVWVPGEVDLSEWAGQEVLMRLESHPGPKHNTTCDSCYWGDPVVIAGPITQTMSDAEKQKNARRAIQAVASGTLDSDGAVFSLDNGCRAAVVPGRHGITDASIAFGSRNRVVVFDGLRIAISDQPVGHWPSAIGIDRIDISRDASNRVSVVHRLRWLDKSFDLTVQLWVEDAGLRVQVRCPERVTDIALGPADQKAPRVYYGHGFCIQNPKAFHAGAGGHNLATSHVGFDFEKNVSLLMASDVPVDFLEVTPERNVYTLHTHPEAMLTFVPGVIDAMDCARRYRPLFDKKASPGVTRKAGRFCFDIWGGRYQEDADLMRLCSAYGVSDAMVIMHVWQRWGYDYRLPDIYPPSPSMGTTDDMRQFSQWCAEHDILFGLHDNYIDFYPDAEDFSYDHIVFTPSGQPQKAWINTSRDAQSYRWRPDHIQPFVERNLKLIQPNIPQSAYFIDVFTSINSFDFYDRQGNFHSKLETRRAWGEAFAWIRDFVGDNAPMCSEAGGDHLIGYIDGADCQFLQITPNSKRFCLRIECDDWERVPWFDSVNHTRLSLHGVGYSGRYQGGRSRDLHGIESDDYLSAEILTGHALMADRGCFVRGAVRKYWLAQDLIRSLANDEIDGFEFDEDDIHRAKVTWKSGATVYVNRGESDWTVAGHTLPQFGYFAKNGEIESSIERIGSAVVEQSRRPGTVYVNGRGFRPNAPLPIRPVAKQVDYLGNRQFKLIVDWHAARPAPKNFTVFMHFFQPQVSRLKKVGFYGGGGEPKPPTSQWNGVVTTGDNWTMTLPDDCPPGRYDILVGLYDRSNRGQRQRLLGQEDPELRYRLGTLVVEGKGSNVTGIRIEGRPQSAPLATRLEPNLTPTEFTGVTTQGAVRCVHDATKNQIVVTPLPQTTEPFTVALDTTYLAGRKVHVRSVTAVNRAGKSLRPVEFNASAGRVSFNTTPTDFAYHVRVDDDN